MPNLNLDVAAETEIQQAVNIGKEVIAHTDPVSVPGYTGAGYIILDPITGEGAYRISGGENGGALISGFSLGTSVGVMLTLAFLTGGVAGLIVAIILVGQIALPAYAYNISVYGDGGKLENCFKTGISIGLAATGILAVIQSAGIGSALGTAGAEWLTGSLTGTYDSASSCL